MMSKEFNNPTFLELEETNRKGWPIRQLVGELRFKIGNGSGSIEIVVPSGFKTDLASAPRILWAFFPPTGRWSRAAILHDFLYTKEDIGSRFLADAIFREAMFYLGVPVLQRVLMYGAVRMFGWAFYRK